MRRGGSTFSHHFVNIISRLLTVDVSARQSDGAGVHAALTPSAWRCAAGASGGND